MYVYLKKSQHCSDDQSELLFVYCFFGYMWGDKYVYSIVVEKPRGTQQLQRLMGDYAIQGSFSLL